MLVLFDVVDGFISGVLPFGNGSVQQSDLGLEAQTKLVKSAYEHIH